MNPTIKNILKKMEKDNFQGYLLNQFTNINYISNYTPTSFAFCVIKEDPVIYASKMDMEIAKKNSTIEIKEFESYSKMANELKEENIYNLAIEPSLSFEIYEKFKDSFKIDSKTYVNTERMIKSKEEIAKINQATTIAQDSFRELDILKQFENKATESYVSYELGRFLRENGGEKESFETIVTSGANASLPHAICENKSLEEPILIDWGVKYQGYCSDNTRTMVFNEKQQEILDIVLEAHDNAIKAIKPGIKCCEIDKVARDIISEYGYGDNYIHSTGHSLGLDIHESPSFSTKDQTILEKNMVLTVEPGIYLENKFGVRIEDTVLVKNSSKIFGNLPQIIN